MPTAGMRKRYSQDETRKNFEAVIRKTSQEKCATGRCHQEYYDKYIQLVKKVRIKFMFNYRNQSVHGASTKVIWRRPRLNDLSQHALHNYDVVLIETFLDFF